MNQREKNRKIDIINNVKDIGPKADNHGYVFAQEKYRALIDRSFENRIRLLLYLKCIKEKNPEFALTDKIFNEIDVSLETEYKKDYQNMGVIRDRNKIIKSWRNDKMNNEKLINLKKLFEVSFRKTLTWNEFKAKYGEDSNDRQCCYCKVKETQLEQMIRDGEINTKRLYSRGRKMEIERIDPFVGYINGNIQLCCYWCNNAKTDEFDYNEFVPIGKEIQKVWEARLGRRLTN